MRHAKLRLLIGTLVLWNIVPRQTFPLDIYVPDNICPGANCQSSIGYTDWEVCVLGGGGLSVCVVYRAYRNEGFISRMWKLGVEAT